MKIIICGDRFWTDRAYLRYILLDLPPGSTVIHGDNGYDEHGHALWEQPDHLAVRGVDKMAGAVAAELGFVVRRYTPDLTNWPRAGPERNQYMLEREQPDEVWAVHASLGKSRGTKDMVRRARAAGVKVRRFTGKEPVPIQETLF